MGEASDKLAQAVENAAKVIKGAQTPQPKPPEQPKK